MTDDSMRTADPGVCGRVLEAWVGLVQRFPILTVLICLGTAGWCVHYAVGHLGFKTDRDDLVNPSESFVRNWNRYTEEFGGESDIVVIVGGEDRAAMVAVIESIAREIEGFPNHFDKLCYKIEADRLRSKGLYQLSVRELQSLQNRLEGVRPILVGSWDWMTVENFVQDARLRLENLPVAGPIDERNRGELLASARLIESLAAYVEVGNVYQSPWLDPMTQSAASRIRDIPEHFFSEDGKFAFLRVIPKSTGASDFVRHREPIRILRSVIARLRPLYPKLEIGLTGLPVLESDEMESTKQGSKWSTIVSGVGVLAVFVFAFRAFRHPVFAMAALAVAGCWTMGFVTATVGHLNILSVSFIVTLIGLGIDYGILWISQFETARSWGLSARRANLKVARSVGPGTAVGAVTTAVAFFATMLNGFVGLRELGWIAAWGVLFCLLAAMTFLPALLALASSQTETRADGTMDLRPLFGVVSRRPAAFAVATMLAAAALVAGLPGLRFDYNLLNLQPRGLASVEWERRLIDRTGTSGWYALSMANSAEEARRLAAEFKTVPTVGRVVEIASLIPPDQPAKHAMVPSIHSALVGLPNPGRIPASPPPNVSGVSDALAAIEKSASHRLGGEILIDRISRAAANARRTLADLPTAEQSRRLAKFQRMWMEDLVLQLHGLRSVADPEPVTVRDLPDSLVRRFYSPTGKWAIQIFAKGSVWDMEPLQRFRDDLAAIDPEITGKPISTVHSLEQMHDGFVLSGGVALAAIFVLAWIDLGRFRHACLAMTPLVVGGAAMFGALGWLGIALNPANLIALPLILGIGVDYGVHVMHDYHASSGKYVLRRRLGRALVLNSITTILSFASLSLAPHWGMVTIGIALAIGVACCSICAIVLLPAILAHATRRLAVEDEEPPNDGLELPSTVHFRQPHDYGRAAA